MTLSLNFKTHRSLIAKTDSKKLLSKDEEKKKFRRVLLDDRHKCK